MSQQNDRDVNKDEMQNENANNFVYKSPFLHTVIFGLSEIMNTRLSDEELEICLELLELGVHPKALADVVLHTLDIKEKHAANQHK